MGGLLGHLDPAQVDPLGGETRAFRHLVVNTVFDLPLPSRVGPGVFVFIKTGASFVYSDGTTWTAVGTSTPITFQDEGVSLPQRNTVNFVGAGVTASDAGGKTVVTIPGGGGSVGTDAIWDAAGDLAVGTGPDAAARLPIGANNSVLSVVAGAVTWDTTPTVDSARFVGAMNAGAQGFDHVEIGVDSGTPRIVFEDAASANIWSIDNLAGQMRFFSNFGVQVFATLDVTGQLSLPVSGSAAGLKIGTDVQVYRSGPNTLRVDSGLANAYMTLNGTTQSFGSAITVINFESTTVAFKAVGSSINVLTFNPASMDIYLPELHLVAGGATFTSQINLIEVTSAITLNYAGSGITGYQFIPTITFQGFDGNISFLFGAGFTAKNVSGVARYLGILISYASYLAPTADNAAVSVNLWNFYSNPAPAVIGTGALTIIGLVEFYATGGVNPAGVTTTLRQALVIADPGSASTRVTTNVGIDIAVLTAVIAFGHPA